MASKSCDIISDSRSIARLVRSNGKHQLDSGRLTSDSISEILENQRTWTRGDIGDGEKQSNVFHVANPHNTSWAKLLRPLKGRMRIERLVPLKIWVDLVRHGPEEDSSTPRNPARKILPFYEPLTEIAGEPDSSQISRYRVDLGNMALCSHMFETLQPVSDEWLLKWAEQWL